MKKLLTSVLTALSMCAALSSCGNVSFDESKKTLVIGLECEYAPFNWTETSKTDTNVAIDKQPGLYADGYDIQMARKICDDLGYTLVVKKISWEGLIPALTSGDIDAIIAGMSPTEDRKVSINFTDEYYRSEHVVIVNSEGPYAEATKFSDFKGANVVGQKGTVFETLAEQLATSANARNQAPLATVPLIISGILLGDTDVTVVEKPVALGVCANNPSLKWIKLDDQFDVAEEDVIVSIGVRKVDTGLLNNLNSALSRISVEDREQLMLNAVNAGE